MPRLSEALDSVLGPEEMNALVLLRDGMGLDIARTHQFWESFVAVATSGRLTPRSCPWDVELDHYAEPIRIEVKFSQEFDCVFRNGTRPVLKFALPRGGGVAKPSDVTVFIGIDSADDVHCWVAPTTVIPQVASITMTSPRVRVGRSRTGLDSWECPPSELLPAVLHTWRITLADRSAA